MSSNARDRFMASSLGSLVAETFTLPIDVIKVRLQLQASNQQSKALMFFKEILKKEGIVGLFKGLKPALIRQISYTSLTLVLFNPIRDLVTDNGTPGYFQRLFSGGVAGSIGITLMNPTEVLKTQIQSSERKILNMGFVLRKIWRSDGLIGFWAGLRPNVVRCFLVNAAELGTYDQAKNLLINYRIVIDGLLAHVGASGVAGIVSALTSTPVDVIKTRIMNQAGKMCKYTSVKDAMIKVTKTEGFFTLYKGFIPICIRKVLWCSMFFVTYEQILLGLEFINCNK